MNSIGDSITIACEKESVTFSVTGDLGTGSVSLKKGSSGADSKDKKDESVTIECKENMTLSFSLKYLINFAKAATLSNQVTIKMSGFHHFSFQFETFSFILTKTKKTIDKSPLVAFYDLGDLGDIRF